MGEACKGEQLAALLMHVGRAAYAAERSGGLSPAQWMCLRYFSRANRFSRTVSGFADFHATSRGTASLTVAGLVRRGLLRRHPSALDGRSQRIEVTESAQRLLADSVHPLVKALDHLPRAQRALLSTTVDRLILALANEYGSVTFGTCDRCACLLANPIVTDGTAQSRCILLDEPLEPDDRDATCMNFKSADSRWREGSRDAQSL